MLSLRETEHELNWPESPWVFSRNGERLKSIRDAFEGACSRAKVNRTIHDFRRTAVRNMTRAGVPRSVAMRISGHKTESVFRRCDITAEADLMDAADKLEKFLAAPDPAKSPSEKITDGEHSDTVQKSEEDQKFLN